MLELKKIKAIKKKIVLIVACLSLQVIGVVNCTSVTNSSKIGMALPFEPVVQFSRSALFCNFHLGIGCIDLSRDNSISSILYRYEANPIFPTAPIAVSPDDSCFYVCSQSDLFEFNSGIKLLRQIPISAFHFEPEKYIFSGTAYASNCKLWLTVTPKETSANKSSFIVEWDTGKRPESRVIGPDVDSRWAVDTATGTIFITKPKAMIYHFATNAIAEQSWGQYSYVDFDETYGLLLSNGPEEKGGVIARVDLKTGSKVNIAEGAWAQWGPGGWIYFVRGNSQLWRCKFDGDELNAVYLASPKAKYGRRWLPSVTFSPDKRFLAFFYNFPPGFGGKRKRGLVFLDLVNKEYRELKNIGFRSMAWVIKKSLPSNSSVAVSKETPIHLQPPFFMKLHDAVFFWDTEEIEFFLKHNQAGKVNSRDKLGNSPLHYAAEIARNDVVQTLISHGADVNLMNSNGMTPLHKAVEGPIYRHRKPSYRTNKVRTVKSLLAFGALTNIKDRLGRIPLDLALQKGDKDIAGLLISAGSDLSLSSRYGKISLHQSVSTGKKEIVEALIASGADISAKDSHGRTVLETAWYMGLDMIKFLVNKGADVNAKFTNGYSPLQLAVLEENEELVRLLLAKGANPNVKDKYGNPLIHEPIKNKSKEILQQLIASGANVNAANEYGYTGLHIATQWEYKDLVDMLLLGGGRC